MEKNGFSYKADLINDESSLKAAPPYILGLNLNARSFRYFMVGLQITFWGLWLLLAYNSLPAQSSTYGPFAFASTHILIFMGLVYINNAWLIPRLLVKRKYLGYFLAFVGLIAFGQVLGYYLDVHVLRHSPIFPNRIPLSLALITLLLFASTLFKFVEGWFQVSQQQVELQNQQLKSELRFLRAQVNPHFLFNTLNNLYSLTLVQDHRAPKMVAQLSELMRYLIYDSSTTRVNLLREMELMGSYIALQQLQYDEEKNVDFYFEGIRNQHQIAPLLLISFLENSFKHGDLATNPEGWIAITAIVEEDNHLHLSFCNSYRPSQAAAQQKGGIGLQNARRQLELNYPDRHTLQLEKRANEFRVDLRIELDLVDRPGSHLAPDFSAIPPSNLGNDEHLQGIDRR
ncbi:MAG: histidine kinase [Bacteroidota bacterium]